MQRCTRHGYCRTVPKIPESVGAHLLFLNRSASLLVLFITLSGAMEVAILQPQFENCYSQG